MSIRGEHGDDDAAERLDRMLDAAMLGTPTRNQDGRVTELAGAAETLHQLDRRDVEPDPAAQFVRHLEGVIMNTQPAISVLRSLSPATLAGDPMRPSQRVPHGRRSVRDPWRFIPQLAPMPFAAIVLLGIIATIAVVAMQPQSSNDRPNLPAAAQAETPVADDAVAEAVDIADCDAEARTSGSVASLVGSTQSTQNRLPLPMNSDAEFFFGISLSDAQALINVLPAASEGESAAVTDTLRQLTACRFTLINPYSLPDNIFDLNSYDDYDGVFYGLFSDDYFRRGLTQEISNADLPILTSLWFPIGPTAPEPTDIRTLGDGRILALIQEPFQARWSQQRLVIFTQDDSRWLIDETATVYSNRPWQPPTSSDEGSARSEDGPQFLDVALRDDGAGIWTAPTNSGIFRSDVNVIVTVANIGTESHRFEIPDLDVDVSVPANHSVSFVLNASAGEYEYRSFSSPDAGDAIQHLDGTFEFIPPGTPIPMG